MGKQQGKHPLKGQSQQSTPWGDLNERQQAYLKAVYEIDQAKEEARRSAAARGRWSRTPASEWRWMPYNASGASLYDKLTRLNYVDPGTGSTFEALDSRGFILRRWEDSAIPGQPILFVQLTPKGRKMVRAAMDYQAPQKLPVGTLREWHWRALCRAWVRGDQGMGYDQDLEDGFGYVSWNTCLRLRDYKVKGEDMALIREGRYNGFQREPFALVITDFGRQYYQQNWARYREMYPEVEAPEPEK